jgi:hypothetical protein
VHIPTAVKPFQQFLDDLYSSVYLFLNAIFRRILGKDETLSDISNKQILQEHVANSGEVFRPGAA